MKSLGNLLKKLSSSATAQTRGETLKSILPMAGVNLGLGMLSGNPVEGIAYGLGDIALNYPAMRLAQRISPGKRITKINPSTGEIIAKNVYEPSGLETATNFGASFGSNILVNSLLAPKQQAEATAQQFLAQQAQAVNPALQSQPAQIAQQNIQRSAVNQTPLYQQALAPNTMYQMQGIEQTADKFQYPGITLPPELLAQLQAGGMA